MGAPFERLSSVFLLRNDPFGVSSVAAGGCSGSGLSQPIIESSFSELGVVFGNERALRDHDAVVARLRVGDDFARIFVGGQAFGYEFVEAEFFRTANFKHASDRLADGDLGHG